ncbi:unnamed protein product [Adineta ricciae]|uniref:peptidylamidoglycolate lyase n=1 Tax=Adineta ricciae TaxID=249248 RepID=A0A813QDW0_ADIRI|nr:unnamed protein product [Adineta ricciae]
MKSLIFLLVSFSFVSTRSISKRENIPILSTAGKYLNVYSKIQNQLSIFHRGSREWNQYSFPDGVHFDRRRFGPIPENTILDVDTRTGEVKSQWGNNTFYMPHGLTIDSQENVWLTDVAMHQVFKYSKERTLVLSLGERFVPGSDSTHFCKPTDVAVSSDGEDIYVADGYCNSRIVKFDSNGKKVRQYQIPAEEKQLVIPHSLVLIESLQLLCVADRENRRIVCFNIKSAEGKVKTIIEHPSLNTIYALTYNPLKNHLYAISGTGVRTDAVGYTFSADSKSFGRLLSIWKANEKFGEPHDLAMSNNGQFLFVGEIRPNRVIYFDKFL